jgi:hypothetical protein
MGDFLQRTFYWGFPTEDVLQEMFYRRSFYTDGSTKSILPRTVLQFPFRISPKIGAR